MSWKRKRKIRKILYIVPEGEDDGGDREILWAHSLGSGLYELQNIPFYSFDLNVEDVVRCDESFFQMPVIKDIVSQSGNRTLRVIFSDQATDDFCVNTILTLKEKNISSEKASFKRYMFNIPPDVDYNWVKDFLKQREKQDLLWLYEPG